jgi:hypothetical protein
MRISSSRLLVSVLMLAGVAGCFEPARAFSAAPSTEERSGSVGDSIAAKLLAQKPPFINTVDSEHRLFYFDIQNSFVYSLVILFSSLGAAAIGFRLQRTGHFELLTKEHRSASRSALGLATILTAIVIGVVSDDAISTFNQANDNIQGLAVDTLTLDKVLDSYGSETALIRKQLREDLRYRITRIQSMKSYALADYQAVEKLPRIELLFRDVFSLKPKNEIQKELRSRAIALIGGNSSFSIRGNMAQKRWLFTVGDANALRPV